MLNMSLPCLGCDTEVISLCECQQVFYLLVILPAMTINLNKNMSHMSFLLNTKEKDIVMSISRWKICLDIRTEGY